MEGFSQTCRRRRQTNGCFRPRIDLYLIYAITLTFSLNLSAKSIYARKRVINSSASARRFVSPFQVGWRHPLWRPPPPGMRMHLGSYFSLYHRASGLGQRQNQE